jgi:DNA-binding response OmpR family regulator
MIPKPFSLDDLGARVRALLDGRQEKTAGASP